MNLVVGSTGVLGSEICRRLRGRGQAVRALVRATSDRSRVQALHEHGAEIITGDLRDAGSLSRACEGVRTVISTTTAIGSKQPGNTIADVDQAGMLTLAQIALHAGVRRFIYISLSSNFALDCALIAAKRAVENHLLQSGIGYTILRPSAFMETWLGPAGGFDVAHRRARIPGDGDAGVSYISAVDVARFAVMCVDNPALHDQIIELGGPDVLTAKQIVRLYEEALGDRFVVSYIPIDQLEQQYAEATDPVQRSFAALTLCLARGDAIPMNATLALFNQRFRSTRSFIQDTLNLTLSA